MTAEKREPDGGRGVRKRLWILALLFLGVLAMGACSYGSSMGEGETRLEVGDRAATYWFDFTLSQVERVESWGEFHPQEGEQLVVCTLELKNTFSSDVPMNRWDFTMVWQDASGEMDGAYPLLRSLEEQLPDEYELEKGQIRQGKLVFVLPQEVEQAALSFQERFVEGEQGSQYTLGNTFQVWFPLLK